MSTFGEMKARVASEMARGDLTASASQVQAAVLSAINFFEKRATFFNEFVDTTHTTTADSEWVTLTATLRPIKFTSVKVNVGSNREYYLDEESYREIDRVDSGQYAGYPELYAYYDGKLRLYPIPNDSYTLEIAGQRRLPEISASATPNATNAWMTDAEEPVRLRAKSVLFRDHVRNPQMSDYFSNEAERAWRELNKQTTKLQSAKRVRRYRW